MSSHNYLDAKFEVWPSQQTWLWFVISPLGGGTIGAAASEAQAIADARSSIEEAQAPVPAHCRGADFAVARWNNSLASLDCYLRNCANPR